MTRQYGITVFGLIALGILLVGFGTSTSLGDEDRGTAEPPRSVEGWEKANLLTREQWEGMREIAPYKGGDAAFLRVVHSYDENSIPRYSGENMRSCGASRDCAPSIKLAISPVPARAPWSLVMTMDGTSPCDSPCPVAPGEYAVAEISREWSAETGNWFTYNKISGSPEGAPGDGILIFEPGESYVLVVETIVMEMRVQDFSLLSDELPSNEKKWIMSLLTRNYLESREGRAAIDLYPVLDNSLNDIE